MTVSGRIVVSNAMALLECAVAHAGVVLLADWLVGEEIRAGRLIDLFPSYAVAAAEFDTAAWCVYPSRDHVPLKVRAFIDALKESVARSAQGH